MRPFLLLSIRADDAAADNEYESFLALAGLAEGELRRVRLDRGALGGIDLRDWSGIWVGGGPFNYTDPPERKSPVQRRVEEDLSRLLDAVVAADFPFLGTCYGLGALGRHQGAVLDRRYPEPVGTVRVVLTAPGRGDPLLAGLPAEFDAFTGHKEAISELPGHAVLLASSAGSPVQAFRVGANVYATQFHPELDAAGMCTRIEVYKHAGYFHPSEADEVKAQARRSEVSHPPSILRTFAGRYGAAKARGGPGGRGAPEQVHARILRRPARRPGQPGQAGRSGGAWGGTTGRSARKVAGRDLSWPYAGEPARRGRRARRRRWRPVRPGRP
jgi:GMP synthase (glutamine-hydrolysing)